MNKKLLALVALALVLCMGLGACAPAAPAAEAPAEEPAPAEAPAAEEPAAEAPAPEEPAPAADGYDPSQKTLFCALALQGHPVFQIVRAGFINTCKDMGYDFQVVGIDDVNMSSYIALIETAIPLGADAVMVWPLGPELYPTINKLNDAGIQVVAPHTPIPEGDCPGLSANFSADPVAYGKEAATAIGDKLTELGLASGSIAVSQTSFAELENNAAASFKATIEANYPQFTVLDPYEEGGELAAATAKNTSTIQANADLVAAFSTTGGGCQSWNAAMVQTNRLDLIVIAMDYTEQNIDLVKNGGVYGFVAQPLYEETKFAVETMDKLLRGESVPYYTALDAPIVTAQNVAPYEDLIKEVKAWFG